MPTRDIGQLISDVQHKRVDDLTIDQANLLNFLILIVDIRYRVRYGVSLQGVKDATIKNKILPDQLTSVDDELEGVSRRRLTDAIG